MSLGARIAETVLVWIVLALLAWGVAILVLYVIGLVTGVPV